MYTYLLNYTVSSQNSTILIHVVTAVRTTNYKIRSFTIVKNVD
jgi:hypothetical protein